MYSAYDICPDCGNPKRNSARKCRSCAYRVGEYRCCTSCKEVKMLSEFRIRTRVTPKPRSVCKNCEAQKSLQRMRQKPPELRKLATRKWEKDNPERFAAQKLRRRLKNLLPSVVEREKALQALALFDSCAICTRPSCEVGTLHIDHDHKTGHFRGLLCSCCNTGLGQFAEDVNRMLSAIQYLKASTAEVLGAEQGASESALCADPVTYADILVQPLPQCSQEL